MLPIQGAQVRSLVRELDPTCCNEDERSRVPQLRPAQPNKYFFKKLDRKKMSAKPRFREVRWFAQSHTVKDQQRQVSNARGHIASKSIFLTDTTIITF